MNTLWEGRCDCCGNDCHNGFTLWYLDVSESFTICCISTSWCFSVIRQANQWTSCCCCCCCQGEVQWRWKWTKHLASWELSADGKCFTTQWSAQRVWFQRVFTLSLLSSSVKPTSWDYYLDLGYLKMLWPRGSYWGAGLSKKILLGLAQWLTGTLTLRLCCESQTNSCLFWMTRTCEASCGFSAIVSASV